MIIPEISVVVPCHNSIRTLDRCFDSLRGQSFNKPYEIIFVDDSSEDGTFGRLQSYRARYPDFVTVVRSSCRGAWSARKTGIEAARADLIAFLDSDDEAKPCFLESLYKSIKDSGSDLVVCGFERVRVDDGVVLSREFCNQRDTITIHSDPGAILSINPAPWNKLFKKAFLSNAFDFPYSPVMFDDLCLLLLALCEVDKVSFVDEPLVSYFVSSNSTINSLDMSQVRDGAQALSTAAKSVISHIDISSKQSYVDALSAMAFIHLGVSMTLRLSLNGLLDKDASYEIKKLLDVQFPSWKRNHYFKFAYCLSHGGIYIKAYLSYIMYRIGLISLFLRAYRLITESINIDIKW